MDTPVATATVDVSADERNHVVVTFQSIHAGPTWHVSGIPNWILEEELKVILKLFTSVTVALLSRILHGHKFDVYAIPTISPRIAGRTFEITLRDLALGSAADGDDKPLVMATGSASVRPV